MNTLEMSKLIDKSKANSDEVKSRIFKAVMCEVEIQDNDGKELFEIDG